MTPAKQRLLVASLLLFGVAIISFFGMRVFHAFRKFDGHRPPKFPHGSEHTETDVALIRDWMTIGYISHTYHMPPDLLYRTLNIRPNGNEDKSLKKLNDEFFPDKPNFVIETVKATIQANLPPTAIPPATAAPAPTTIPPATP